MVDACQDEAIQCLQEAVQTPSPTGEELAISRLFTRWIADCGLTVEQYEAEPGRPNLIAQWHGSRPGKRFLFNGHLDVFPPSDGDGGWYGPWSGKIADGFLYGRGAVDMKGGDCAALMAVRLLRRMNFDPKGSVILSYMVDEENKDYIRMARAKGVPQRAIGFNHVFRNAIVPLIHGIPSSLLLTISGSIYVESLYSIPGMGGLLVEVIKMQDNSMVQALVIVYAALGIIGLLMGDILMAVVDPRISLTKKEGAR